MKKLLFIIAILLILQCGICSMPTPDYSKKEYIGTIIDVNYTQGFGPLTTEVKTTKVIVVIHGGHPHFHLGDSAWIAPKNHWGDGNGWIITEHGQKYIIQ